MTSAYFPFIDWMKCLGIALIVYGHVSATADHLIPPIYPKQLGVAFFLFVTGFSLARETRRRTEVLFRRLFEILLYGTVVAMLVSVVNFARIGDLNESNYLPLLLGVNVVLNSFPANPTTWFIGTYIHILLLWAFLLRGLRVRPWMLAVAAVAEVSIRAMVVESGFRMVAYMIVPNWATVFLMGLHYGQQHDEESSRGGPAAYLTGFVLLIVAWWSISNPFVSERSFPFMRLTVGHPIADVGVMSVAVTAVYASYTWLTFQVTRRLRASAPVRFFARNTMVIFIAHMPIYYALRGPLARWTDSYGLQVGVQMTVNFLLLAVASELLDRALHPRLLREQAWRWLSGPAHAGAGPSRGEESRPANHPEAVVEVPR